MTTFSSEHLSGPNFGILAEGEETYEVIGVDKAAAEFGAMLLSNDGLGDLEGLEKFDRQFVILEAITSVECVCGEIVFAAELDMAGECPSCLS